MDLVNDRQDLHDAIRATEAFIPQIGKGSGWLPQTEDSRDYQLVKLLGADAPPPMPNSDLSPRFLDVRDQGQLGACTGFGTTAAVEYLIRSAPRHYKALMSPLFSYYHGRKAINEVAQDEGAYVRDVVKAAADVGVARERDWMYYEVYKTFCREPTARAFKSAEKWKLGGYYACNSLDDIRAALSLGYPVVGGFLCYSNLGQAWKTGIIPEPSGNIIGGHCVTFVGHDDARRLLKFKNSWGSYWGDGGYGYLPYSFAENKQLDDCWALQSKLIVPK